jgi:ribosomal protein S18 acetylase RimI-like enzyme
LSRALAFERRQRRAACERAVAHPVGEAFLHPALPRAYVMNSLHVDRETGPETLVAALDELYAGFLHRRAFVERFETGERLAPALRARRWLVERDVYMALRRPRDREPVAGLAREVDGATLAIVEAATTRDEPYGSDEDVVRQLTTQREELAAAVPSARFVVGAVDGVDAAVTTLYSDGVVAQVEDVATRRAHRRRGLARATVSLAIDMAIEMEHELVFIVADDDDWPKDLYGRLGFDPIGYAWAFTRPGPEHPAHVPVAAS